MMWDECFNTWTRTRAVGHLRNIPPVPHTHIQVAQHRSIFRKNNLRHSKLRERNSAHLLTPSRATIAPFRPPVVPNNNPNTARPNSIQLFAINLSAAAAALHHRAYLVIWHRLSLSLSLSLSTAMRDDSRAREREGIARPQASIIGVRQFLFLFARAGARRKHEEENWRGKLLDARAASLRCVHLLWSAENLSNLFDWRRLVGY